MSGLTVNQARVMEQIVISAYVAGPGRVDGHLQGLDNIIRAISRGKIKTYFSVDFEKAIELFETVAEDELRNLVGR